MIRSNKYFSQIPANYLFATVAHKVAAHKAAHPEAQVISLGIGDVTRPLPPSVIAALHKAVDDMGTAAGFHGYGPEQGYAFLRETIAQHDFQSRGAAIEADDIFVSDGAKCDVGNFQELFSPDARIAVTDPVYPVYVDSNAMRGRAGTWTGAAWSNIIYMPCTAENDFVPEFPKETPDVIYLCYPNNPTGAGISREALTAWVEYARKNKAIILYDAAYEAFITTPGMVHSIYEIEGAQEVAVEFRSFSKTAGFTGLRCAYTVVPRGLTIADGDKTVNLHALWNRRQCTKYNGCPYIVQRAAEAVYSPQGAAEVRQIIDGYLSTAATMKQALSEQGFTCCGGVDSPYLWVRVPQGQTSWGFFELLLSKLSLVCTPGAGFGPSGEGYVRLTAFGTAEQTRVALERLKTSL